MPLVNARQTGRVPIIRNALGVPSISASELPACTNVPIAGSAVMVPEPLEALVELLAVAAPEVRLELAPVLAELEAAAVPLPSETVLAVPYPIVPLTSWVVDRVRFCTGWSVVDCLGCPEEADADPDESDDATIAAAIPPPTITTAAPIAIHRRPAISWNSSGPANLR